MVFEKIKDTIFGRKDTSTEKPASEQTPEEPQEPALDERIANMDILELRDEYAGIKAQRDLLNDALAERDAKIEHLNGQVIERSKGSILRFDSEMQELYKKFEADNMTTAKVLDDIAKFISQPIECATKKDIRFAEYQAMYKIMEETIHDFIARIRAQMGDKGLIASREQEVRIRSEFYNLFKRVARIAETHPELDANTHRTADENAKLRADNEKFKRDNIVKADELAYFRQQKQLRDMLKVIVLAAQSSEAMRTYFDNIAPGVKGLALHANVDSTQEIYAKIYVGKLIELTQREEGWDTAGNIAMRDVHALSTKLTLLMNLLKEIAPGAIEGLQKDLKGADKLDKDRIKKGEFPKEYRAVVSAVIPKIFVSRTELDLLIKSLITELKEQQPVELRQALEGKTTYHEITDAVTGLISDTFEKQRKIVQYSGEIITKVYSAVEKLFPEPNNAETATKEYVQDRSSLTEILNEENVGVKGKKIAEFITNRLATSIRLQEATQAIAENKVSFYELITLATGKEPDDERFTKDPAGYVLEAVNQLKENIATAAQYTVPLTNPVTLVKQAYVHQMLGNAYVAENQEDKAREQYDKAKKICEHARDFAADDVKEDIESEIAKFEEFAGVEK